MAMGKFLAKTIWLALLIPFGIALASENLQTPFSCPKNFAQLKKQTNDSKVPFVAVSVGAHAVAGGALLYSQGGEKESKASKSEKSESKEETLEEFFGKKEELPPLKPLPKEEVIRRSQENLLSWQKNRKFKYPLGELLIHSEAPYQEEKEILRSALKYYQEDQSVLREMKGSHIGSKEDLIEKATVYLFDQYITRYCGGKGLMSFFYGSESCGNCQANTKLILANLIDAGIAPPEGMKFGAQLYTDHIAPVLIEEKTKKTLDLAANKLQLKPSAAVYEPSMLLEAYLHNEGIDSKVPLKSLLIAEGISKEIISINRDMISNTSFRGGSGAFRGDAPDFKRSTRGSLEMAFGGGSTPRGGAGHSESDPYSKLKKEEIKFKIDPKHFQFNYTLSELFEEWNGSHGNQQLSLLLRNQKTKDYCEESIQLSIVKGMEDCRNFAKLNGFKEFQQSPSWKNIFSVAENPAKILKLSNTELKEMTENLSKFNSLLWSLPKNRDVGNLLSNVEKLDSKIQEHPEKFIELVRSMNKDQTTALQALYSNQQFAALNRNQRGKREKLEGLRAVTKLLRDNTLIGLQEAPSDNKENEYVLTFYGDGKGKWEKGVLEKVAKPDLKSGIGQNETTSKSVGSREGKGDERSIKEAKEKFSASEMANLRKFLVVEMGHESYPNQLESNHKGLAKFFTEAVVKENIETRNYEHLENGYENDAKEYFKNLDLSKDPELKDEFLHHFSNVKFYRVTDYFPPNYDKLDLGVMPEYLARSLEKSIKGRNKHYYEKSQPEVWKKVSENPPKLEEIPNPIEYFSRSKKEPQLKGPFPATNWQTETKTD